MINTIDAQKEYIKSFEESITKEMKNGKYEKTFVYTTDNTLMVTSKPKITKECIELLIKNKIIF